LNRQNPSIEGYRVRRADHPTSKSQPPGAKAPRGRDFAHACSDGPIAIVRHTAVSLGFAAALALTNCKGFVREMRERVMRAKIVAGCVALALLVSGCDPARDSRFVREGIGTDLYWDGLPAATQLQDIYLANMCAQAISPTARSLDPLSCDGLNLASRDWGLLVQAGMNDIDLRCDSYLSWLHDKRSSREPILKELAVLGGAAAAILRATDVGATPIALTAIAFGIAAESFTNYDLRILNGVDYTTVQTVVRGNRTQFRGNNLSLVIDNRPAAIYVLRNYLSICLPASIEMSINNTVNVYHRGGPEALRSEQVGLRTPVATGATSATVRGAPVAATARTPVNAGGDQIKRKPSIVSVYTTYLETFDADVHSSTYVEGVLNALCVPPAEYSSPTKVKALIRAYEAGIHQASSRDRANGLLDSNEMKALTRMGPCPDGFRNAYERTAFKSGTAQGIAKPLSKVPGVGLVAETTSLKDLRDKVITARRFLQMEDKVIPDQITRDFFDRLDPP